MQLIPLTTPEQVDTFIEKNPLCAIFKAGTCHKTTQGFSVIESLLRDHELPMGFIRVVEQRDASNHVTHRTGIVHHSPQWILFQEGQSLFDVDNWNITPEALKPIFQKYVPSRHSNTIQIRGDLEPYKQLIQSYLSGQINDAEFQTRYVNLFRYDASLRSKEEFELLSRLFGDPDAYHGGLHQLVPANQFPNMQGAARQLLEQLHTL